MFVLPSIIKIGLTDYFGDPKLERSHKILVGKKFPLYGTCMFLSINCQLFTYSLRTVFLFITNCLFSDSDGSKTLNTYIIQQFPPQIVSIKLSLFLSHIEIKGTISLLLYSLRRIPRILLLCLLTSSAFQTWSIGNLLAVMRGA